MNMRDVLGRLEIAFAGIEQALDGARISVVRKRRVHAAALEALRQIARLEREIERVEIAEGDSHD